MNQKPFVIVVSLVVGVILLTGACSAGFVAGQIFQLPANPMDFSLLIPELEPAVATQVPTDMGGTPDDLQELFEPFWQTWNVVQEEFVEQPVDDEAMMRGAIHGMLDSLEDDHTSYLDPEMFERANAQLEGEEYEGIGAWVDTTGDYLTIVSPMPDSPADQAGLRPNDKIIAVDGEDMTGMDGELVRQKVIGPEGTVVRLTVQREGQEPFDVEIVRAKIAVPTIEGRILVDEIAYVRLYTFGADTGSDLHRTLRDLFRQDPKGLILDLRNNGGGYLDTAIEVVSEFIDEGVVMYEVYGDGTRKSYEAKGNGLATGIPLVVLINEGSASASEIVAGAIQDLDRGTLVGMTSFGKGSVQNYLPLVNDQGAIRVTIARWLTPTERQIHGVGLEPEVVVEITEEDIDAGIDSQLEKAIEILLGLINEETS